jgi:hypothetical protein
MLALLLSGLVATQGFIPENKFKTTDKLNGRITMVKATHYESIADVRQVEVKYCYLWKRIKFQSTFYLLEYPNYLL